jgi:hypothetical protein
MKPAPFDVFVCYSHEARFLGELVVQSLEEAGLRAYRPWIAGSSGQIPEEDDIRDVLLKCRAVVGAHMVGRDVDPLLLIAIGAARERRIPCFLVTDETWTGAPAYLGKVLAYSDRNLAVMSRTIATKLATQSRSTGRQAAVQT